MASKPTKEERNEREMIMRLRGGRKRLQKSDLSEFIIHTGPRPEEEQRKKTGKTKWRGIMVLR
jgi:hypothetical protein